MSIKAYIYVMVSKAANGTIMKTTFCPKIASNLPKMLFFLWIKISQLVLLEMLHLGNKLSNYFFEGYLTFSS